MSESHPATAERSWQRVLTMAQKLFEALEDLEGVGGTRHVGVLSNPKAASKALATLRATRAALHGPIRELEQRPGRSRGG